MVMHSIMRMMMRCFPGITGKLRFIRRQALNTPKCIRCAALCLGYILVTGYLWNVIHQGTSQGPAQAENGTQSGEGKCEFGNTFDENLRKIENLHFHGSMSLVKKLGFHHPPSRRQMTSPSRRQMTSLPVLATGASNIEFFFLSRDLIHSINTLIRPRYPDIKLVFYDMGMTKKQANEVRRICQCEVRKFPYEKYPEHVQVNARTYAFKPIIINTLFQEFGHVWWLDASMRFITRDLDLPFRYLDDHGILFFTASPSLNIAHHTDAAMFRYFQEEACRYMNFGEIECGNVAFRDSHVARVVLKQWVSCALDRHCIAPQDSRRVCPELQGPMNETQIGTCHRFDQSALGILLRRLYHEQNDYPLTETPMDLVKLERWGKVDTETFNKFMEDT